MDKKILWGIGAIATGALAYILSDSLRRYLFTEKVLLNCKAMQVTPPEFARITITNRSNVTLQKGQTIYRKVDGAIKDVYGLAYKKQLLAPLAPGQSIEDVVLGQAGMVHTCEAWVYV